MLSDHCHNLVSVFKKIGIPVTVKQTDDGFYRYEYVAIGEFPEDIDADEMIRRAEVWFQFGNGRLETYPPEASKYEFFRKGREN